MTPLQLLEMQADFVARHETSGPFREYLHGCFSPLHPGEPNKADDYTRLVGQQFRLGEAYRVTEDMVGLVEFAASRLDATDLVDATLPPTPFGVVRFERPIRITDVRGREMKVHWMTWGQMSVSVTSVFKRPVEHRAVWITTWNDMMVDPDEVSRMNFAGKTAGQRRLLRQGIGRWGFVGTDLMIAGESLGEPMITVGEYVAQQVAADGHAAVPFTNVARLAHALWLLLGQTVADTREEPLTRAAAKRVGRMPIPGRVTVIQLRRRESRRSEGETHVEWQHRWLVRGHWRWQPYADGRVERIWIAPYVKGPDDKPFKQTAKVYSLSR